MLNEILGFLTVGVFVYLGLKIKFIFGDPIYYTVVVLCLISGLLLTHYSGR